jgi:hypothetical protein
MHPLHRQPRLCYNMSRVPLAEEYEDDQEDFYSDEGIPRPLDFDVVNEREYAPELEEELNDTFDAIEEAEANEETDEDVQRAEREFEEDRAARIRAEQTLESLLEGLHTELHTEDPDSCN